MRLLLNKFLKANLFALIFFCLLAVSASATEKDSILKACAHQFGPPVDAAENLFEVNYRYALQLKFDRQGELTRMSVCPKYYLDEIHPAWAEPREPHFLSKTEYENLLTRLDEIKSKGQLLEAQTSDIMTNSTLFSLNQYQNAFLERGERDDDIIRFFNLYFYHQVEGKVKQKRKFKYSDASDASARDYYAVLLDKCSYLVTEDIFYNLKVGKNAKISGAGPYSVTFDGDDDSDCDF